MESASTVAEKSRVIESFPLCLVDNNKVNSQIPLKDAYLFTPVRLASSNVLQSQEAAAANFYYIFISFYNGFIDVEIRKN